MVNKAWIFFCFFFACACVAVFMVGSRISPGKTTFWGWFFIAIGAIFLPVFVFAAVVSKLLPQSDNPVIAAVQNDRYYYLLVPLILPVLVVAVYFHWLSMKLFKHA